MNMDDTALALIGMSGRFPGAQTVEDFWRNLAGGVKSLRSFSEKELLEAGVDPRVMASPEYVRAGAPVRDIDLFDAAFFGYTRREAEMMDPQHRLFLECAWEALENAGYAPDACPGSVGVFAGSGLSTYTLNNLYTHPDFIETMGQFQVNMTNERDSLASMVSYKLNLRGPALAVQTFCSTSLVAVHLACQSLLTYECDLALAGGVAISVPQVSGYLYSEGGMLSPDGECRTFDAQAQGSVMGNGVGIVALKRLRDALDEGAPVIAVIRGSAVNNDGNLRVSYTAPGLQGQAEVIAEALGHADVDPSTIGYIEAHGTGTRLGDAVELAALLRVFGQATTRKQFCALGSLKPNVGHLDRAAGITGLIKTSLALFHKQLPPTLNFTGTHADIDLQASAFYVNTQLRDWPEDETPRRAGVSAFGLGGTNAHVVLEEAPALRPSSPAHSCELLVLSGRTESALRQIAANLAIYLRAHEELNLADVAYTLQVGRSAFNYRLALTCQKREEALSLLEQAAQGLLSPTCQTRRSAGSDLHAYGQTLREVRDARERVRHLEKLGQLWLDGEQLNWADLYQEERRQRLALPTYPFERQRYWIDPPALSRPLEVPAGKLPDRGDWFYRPAWQSTPLSMLLPQDQPETCWLILTEPEGALERLAFSLRERGQSVQLIYPGESLQRLNANDWTLAPSSASDYKALLQATLTDPQARYHIVHGWSLTTRAREDRGSNAAAFQEQQIRGFYSLLSLAQALDNHSFLYPARVSVVTNNALTVHPGEQIICENTPLAGLCKVLAQEQTGLHYRFLDLDLRQIQSYTTWQALDWLAKELEQPVGELLVAYRGQERLTPVYRGRYLGESRPEQDRLRQGGIYLLSGGLGKIGLKIAGYLAQHYQARLILVGRQVPPERESWPAWLATHAPDDTTGRVIRQLQALETMGAEVMVVRADVADARRMAQVFELAERRFGGVDGVIHLAGCSTGEAFQSVARMDQYTCEMHFQPKVYGLYALQEVLQERQLDFCLLFSSLSAILGGLGFAGYTAANLFMDAFAYQCNLEGKTPWICVDWDSWPSEEDTHGQLGKTIAAYEMTTDEALDVLGRVLSSGETHLVHSTGQLDQRLRTWLLLEGIRETSASNEPHQVLGSDAETMPARIDYEEFEPLLVRVWQEALGVEEVSLYDNFFDLGGNSLNGLQVIARLRKLLNMPLSIVALFEAPTISAMAGYLRTRTMGQRPEPEQQLAKRRQQLQEQGSPHNQGIAVIALAGRFPGAPTIEAFWENLREGRESLTFFSEEELLAAGIPADLVQRPNYVRARPILSEVATFDAAFFGYSPREAELLDPQHRLFLECCWEALERAGYDPATYAGLISVFGGTNMSSYLHNLLQQPEIVAARRETINAYQLAVSMDKDSLTTMVSYKLNLKGPSLGVQTFCSTSLVAVHLACQSLLAGESDMAIAGGVSLRIPISQGHLYEPGGQESSDGHCRAFDAQADGCMFGDGAGVVVLKRLSEAVEDGDLIQAVIRGSAMNNDGSLKVSYSAPSVAGQAEATMQALRRAEIHPESISYVEAHGSATELGDPIEVASLTRAFRSQTERVQYCALGSVKTNVGHLDRAAGVTGLIKAVLALQHELIPPTLHFHQPHPAIDFAHSPFYVNAVPQPWPRGETPRRAGVNSLGMGGTNAHVIIEEAPQLPASSPSRSWQMLLLSARTHTALQQMTMNLRNSLQAHPEVPLADIAYTLQVGKQRFAYRRMLLCRTHQEALELLSQDESAQVPPHYETRLDRPVAFLLPGVGELYPGAINELYQEEPVFRHWLERCCHLLRPYLDLDLRDFLLTASTQRASNNHSILVADEDAATSPEAQHLAQTRLAQPAIFAVEYALAQLLMHWGLSPQAMLGYSVGEYVAACLAGIFTLEEALRVIARRAWLIQELPEGAMLAVFLDEQSIQPYLRAGLSLAAINTPTTCVLSGPREAIEQAEAALRDQSIATRRVVASHAFHSTMLEPARPALLELLKTCRLNPPTIPYISNVTGTWISAEQAQDPAYWVEHMCQTVHYAQGVQILLEETACALVEVGPGHSLAAFARQHPACTGEQMARIIATLPTALESAEDAPALSNLLGKLWLIGCQPDWQGYYSHERRRRVLLPTYPFERQRYWIDGPGSTPTDPIEQLIEREGKQRLPLDQWFFLPSWQRAMPPLSGEQSRPERQTWLLLASPGARGAQIASELRARGHEVILVLPGEDLTRLDQTIWTLRPETSSDYEALLKALRTRGQTPQQILHLWTEECEPDVATNLEYGLSSLLALTQALGTLDLAACQLTILSSGLYDVLGNEEISPAKALLTGPCKVIPQEYPQMHCCLLDLPPALDAGILVEQLISGAQTLARETVVALRGSHLWVPAFEPVPLARPEQNPPAFKHRGVYLITGGLGGIGLALAEHLARSVQARLVLLGRSAFPVREQWPDILSAESETSASEQVRRIRQVLALENLGSEVMLIQADVSDAQQMHAAITRALAHFGEIQGVFHAAGTPASGLIQRKTPEMVERVLAPKVYGTQVLLQALEGLSLDFVVLFSSLCSTTGGGPGQVDYCSANAFLDAVARTRSQQGIHTVAIDWGEWQWNAWESGLAGYPIEAQQYFRMRRERFGMSFSEGIQALECVLVSGLTHVIVSSEDFQQTAASSASFSTETIMQALTQLRQERADATVYPRPLLTTPYVPPEGDLECEIARQWSELLGIEQIGVDDNFLELGGHSLLGTQLITRLRQAFQVNLRLTTLFMAPTIRELAIAIELLLIEELEQVDASGEEPFLLDALAYSYEKGSSYVYE